MQANPTKGYILPVKSGIKFSKGFKFFVDSFLLYECTVLYTPGH